MQTAALKAGGLASSARAALIALTACAALGACSDSGEPSRIQADAEAISAELAALSENLNVVESDLQGFLIGDSRAKQCFVEHETQALANTFDVIGHELSQHARASDLLAQSGVEETGYGSPDAQLAAHRDMLERARGALAGARDLSALLRDSVSHRDDYKQAGDRAWYAVLARSDSITPWFNRQKEAGGDQADAAIARMDELLQMVDQAKRLHSAVQAGYDAARKGLLYNCSSWAVAVTRLQKLATDVDSTVSILEANWKP